MIKTIISDLGNVLVFFDNDLFFQRMEPYSPYSAGEMQAMAHAYIPLLRAFDTGAVSPEDFFQKVTRILKVKIKRDEFFAKYNDVFWLNPPPLAILASLKGYVKLVLLSNTDEERFGFVKKTFPEILVFDAYILSYEVGFMKPHQRIYQAALEKAEARPEECVFIDDRKENIQAATAMQMAVIHFLPETDLKAELTSCGAFPEIPSA